MEGYSQIGQDLFVINALQEMRDGLFLDVGAAAPQYINNTYLLEKHYNWSGISIEFDKRYESVWSNSDRKNSQFILKDARTVDYDTLIGNLLVNRGRDRIDYLSVDLEPPSLTLDVLHLIPFNKYKFSVITYEHDMYRCDVVNDPLYTMRESRKLFDQYGYKLVFANKQEDWWVDPTLFNSDTEYYDINTIPG